MAEGLQREAAAAVAEGLQREAAAAVAEGLQREAAKTHKKITSTYISSVRSNVKTVDCPVISSCPDLYMLCAES